MGKRSFIPTVGVNERAGEPFRFDVDSRTFGMKPYLVDLEEFNWNGQCGCRHFETKMQPLLVRGADPASNLRCWHIERARDYFLRKLGPKLAAQFYANVKASKDN